MKAITACGIGFCYSLLISISGANVYAQALPGSADPGRIRERVEKPVPAAPELEKETPKKGEGLSTLPVPAAEGFVLQEISVEGATAMPQEEIASIYGSYLGQRVNLYTLHGIAGRITELYRQKGYFLSKAVVPEQQIKDGKVKLAVIEGYVSQVRLEGDAVAMLEGKDRFGLLEQVQDTIRTMRPLNGPRLEEQLLRLSDLAGVRVHSVLEALPEENAAPGAVGMVLQFTARKYSGQVEVNNHGSRFVGPWQSFANLSKYHNIVSFDTLSLNMLTSLPTDEVKYVSGEYSVPVNLQGTRVAVRAGYSDSAPGFSLEPSEIRGDSHNFGVGLQQSLLRSRKLNVNAGLDLDIKDTTTDTLGVLLSEDRIRAIRLSADVARQDDWDGVNSASLKLSQGLDVLDATETGVPNLSRAEGRSDFTKLESSLSRYQLLGANWKVSGNVRGQYAWSPLLSAEEFGYGGETFGRAFDPSELLGDHGLAGEVELSYRPLEIPGIKDFRIEPFIFYDIGKVWNMDTGAGEAMTGASTGGGIKFLQNAHFSGELAVAVPLIHSVNTPLYGNGKNPRYLLQFSYSF